MKRSRAKAAASRSAITLGMLINILMSMALFLILTSFYFAYQMKLETTTPVHITVFPESMDEAIFLPGSLKMDRTEVLRKCYVSPSRYKNHVRRSTMCTKSNKYSLVYFMLPKSGSSTGRHVMKHSFDSREFSTSECRHPDRIKYGPSSPALKTVSMRNPLSRFYASYDEMFVRRLGSPSRIPLQYRRFMEEYNGWNYSQYSALFDETEGVRRLTNSFETFVHDYDGVNPFDEHLTLQSPLLADSNGLMRDIDLVFDTHGMDDALHHIADLVHAPPPEVIRGRAYPRRINVTALRKQTVQKICRLSAIDFCCLNYELPKECLDADVPKGMNVRCQWAYKPELKQGMMIEATFK